MFEIIRRDGLARIGKFETRAGVLETPALLPVVNPKIATVTPRELYDEFGFRALITNSYIIRNTASLKQRAQDEGLHSLLDFPGIIMTDSGTFQSHMYGEVEVSNHEIIEFQRAIGSDIGTVLDIFTEPFWTKGQTEASIHVTLERTAEAVSMKGDMMIAGVVQGSVYPDLREMCASEMRAMDVNVHPIGGVVPLMEQYRYEELADVIIASKKGLSPDRPVHLFGAGHPMVLSLAVLLGCDMFDSASYAKFARDDRMMFIDGTYRIADMHSLDCRCPACKDHTLESLKKLPNDERTRTIARHNLYEIVKELAIVKRYILEGRLWELVEQRCRAHPALLDALRSLRRHTEFLERYEPLSRDGAMFYTGSETRNRPIFHRYMRRLQERYIPATNKAALFEDGGKPYSRHYADDFLRVRSSGFSPIVLSPFGPVPAELDEVYPIAQSLFPNITDSETSSFSEDSLIDIIASKGFTETLEMEDIEAGNETFDPLLERTVAVARYQFGTEAADALMRGKIELVTSKNTGKIRNVISDGEHILSMRADDGLFTLRPEGAARIVAGVPGPHMRVVVSDDAVPFVTEGKSVFCAFVKECDVNIRPMEEVLVVNGDGKLVAVGRAMLVRDEMLSFKKGIAVKVRDGVRQS
ncbi:MAG: tRNA guanosine(15) transglycosylase TgtA [Methanomassiliicoccaceae archaeon]|jgi:7-cyano-7-deazaguanine tRNA-ribosyltransferase|nr:tRNA guanosine(15) transglycosylase TgtA [Methanomassiliicoccaceae archaeon]